MRFDEERGSTLCFNDDANDTALPKGIPQSLEHHPHWVYQDRLSSCRTTSTMK